MGQTTDSKGGAERRQHARIKRNYIIRFYDKNNPSLKIQISQIENISKGGLCFTSSLPFEPGTDLSVELRTPYISDSLFLQGHILDSKEKVRGMIYENRLKFHDISARAADVLEKIELYNTHQG